MCLTLGFRLYKSSSWQKLYVYFCEMYQFQKFLLGEGPENTSIFKNKGQAIGKWFESFLLSALKVF